MTKQEFIEKLAIQVHTSWCRYMSYFLGKCKKKPIEHLGGNTANILFADYDLIIPHEYVDAIQKQIDTPYEMLSEQEKQADRDEVAHILPIIKAYKTSQHNVTKYFKLSMSDAGKAMEKVWKAQTKAGLKKTKFHISGSLEVSVWTEEALGEIMLRDVLKAMKIAYEEGHEQQVKTFLDEMFGSIEG